MKHPIAAALLMLATFAVIARAEKAINPAQAKTDPDGTLWFDVRALGVEAQGWTDTKAPFDRLPAKAEKSVPAAVWGRAGS